MAPRKSPASRGSVDGTSASADPSTSTSAGQAEQAAPDTTAGEGAESVSQILAEMAHSNSAPNSRSRAPRTTRQKTTAADFAASSSNSPALSPGSLSLPSLPNVSTDERGVSPPVDKLPVPPLSAQNAPVESPANTVAESAEGGEEDELAHSGEGDDGLDADGQPRTPGARGKGMKKGDKRARGNGDEHKSMTEAEWEQSRKANHKEVERRRRETINAGLDALSALLPPAPPPPPGSVTGGRAAKPNKSEILGQGINYIKTLKKAQQAESNKWSLEKMLRDQEIKKGQQEIEKLKEENEQLKKRIEELEGGGGGENDEAGRENKRRRVEQGPVQA